MNVDTKLADKRHDKYKELFVNLNSRLTENQKRLEEEEKLSTSHIPTDRIREKLRDTKIKMSQYEETNRDGWDEITSVIEGMIQEIESLFDKKQPIEK